MKEKLKEHAIIFAVVALFIHLCTSYMEGTLNPMYFSKNTRETQMIMFVFLQVLTHYAWFNREKIAKELKK
jgi:hypothetical protein